MQDVINYFVGLPLLELLAVLSALAYVVLAAKGNIWCWPAAIVSTVLYTSIFYDVYLWMDSALQVYYLAMAFYGWYCWRTRKDSASEQQTLVISQWQLKSHLIAIVLLSITSVGVGWLMAEYTPTHFPYFDAATTVFAIFATYLVTQKVLENWLYWVVIDLASIYLYVQKALTPTAVLFVLYVFLATYGYVKWRKEYQQQLALP